MPHLNNNQLPTIEHCLRHLMYVQQSHVNSKSLHIDAKEVSDLILEIWQNASIPTVHENNVLAKLKRWHEKLSNLKRPPRARRQGALYEQKIFEFQEAIKKCFDISNGNIQPAERYFYDDQIGVRIMYIGGLDKIATQKISATLTLCSFSLLVFSLLTFSLLVFSLLRYNPFILLSGISQCATKWLSLPLHAKQLKVCAV